ncbi:alpha-amylase family glycosyl hydrolase [Chitinophaga sp. 30R24]|uniref:alpha-amylase family glycosyl hydrolase n=1 Tax=Chitinophaga sp. 30R24 TaxID=3248838 RepID=UPI003B901190
MATQSQAAWWQTGIIYQIYPRSFQDSNGDGIGDLNGIIQRLDYLQWLGITTIWLSPIFPSPMADFGYDISDYKGIHPLFGTMKDFGALLYEVHRRDMKLLLDLVPNHTSDQHPWFRESRSSRTNSKRDWYLWRDALPDGSVPNNWLSVFGGSAWEWDEVTNQYYYHGFLKEQPDLNWRNPEVQAAMADILHFWLDKGVDGFRVDVMWHMIKDAQWRNNPPDPSYQPDQPDYDQLLPVFSTDQPEVLDIVHLMRQIIDEYSDRMMIGEVYLPIHRLVTYYGVDNKGAHLPFNFLLLSIPWDAILIADAIAEYENALPPDGWPNWVLGNHDRPRIPSRIGIEQTRIAAMLLLSLRGTPTIYYGEELGMADVAIPPAEIQDPQGLNMPDKNLSRDPARTPMQWDDTLHAGFTTGKPWLRLSADHIRNNVLLQQRDSHSVLHFYRRLIALRQQEPSLLTGNYISVAITSQLLVYLRQEEGYDGFLVILNLSHRTANFTPTHELFKGTVVLATNVALEGTIISFPIALNGNEGLIVRIA